MISFVFWCLFVCLSVDRITRKVYKRFSRNPVGLRTTLTGRTTGVIYRAYRGIPIIYMYIYLKLLGDCEVQAFVAFTFPVQSLPLFVVSVFRDISYESFTSTSPTSATTLAIRLQSNPSGQLHSLALTSGSPCTAVAQQISGDAPTCRLLS